MTIARVRLRATIYIDATHLLASDPRRAVTLNASRSCWLLVLLTAPDTGNSDQKNKPASPTQDYNPIRTASVIELGVH